MNATYGNLIKSSPQLGMVHIAYGAEGCEMSVRTLLVKSNRKVPNWKETLIQINIISTEAYWKKCTEILFQRINIVARHVVQTVNGM